MPVLGMRSAPVAWDDVTLDRGGETGESGESGLGVGGEEAEMKEERVEL